MTAENNAIEMLHITKVFPGVVANDDVCLSVRKNEVHAILGENGAGKSTLMSILFGNYEPDEGIIKINGNEVKIKNPNDATALGIGMVHQHFKLVERFTVTENIVLGLELKNKIGNIDIERAKSEVLEISQKYGLNVDPNAVISDITVGMQQRVEILKTLYRKADILILDEPSAVLTPNEIKELLEIIQALKEEGKTVIIITHKLKEIKAVADRCTIMRLGKTIDTVNVSETSEQELAELMVGRAVNFFIDKPPMQKGELVFETKNLSVMGDEKVLSVDNVSIQIHAGEILGLAGVDGNGQKELVAAITGLAKVHSGSVFLNGKELNLQSIKERIQTGLGHVPDDRQKYGLIMDFSIAENLVLKNYDTKKYSTRTGAMDFKGMEKNAETLISEFDIRSGDEGAKAYAGNLSGGNQQKMIIAREISLSPSFLLIVQPTRGLDVGAIEYIRKRIIEERNNGKAVLLISFELDEIMNLCDTIAVISRGKIENVYDAGKITEKEIGMLMGGGKNEEK
ncbi:MAG: heme ABC transporter ATP-binding protein [Treponema sp.]|nr:MAG: heme ABC transporter ATP-binding protein [Treponema sp.]